MRPYREPLKGQGVFFAAQFSAGYITNMPAFDLRQAHRSFRQLRRFHCVINSDKVFGTHKGHFLALPIYFPFALSAISTRRRRMRCRAAAAVGLGYVENRYALPSGAAIIRRRASICASSFCTSIPKVVPPK